MATGLALALAASAALAPAMPAVAHTDSTTTTTRVDPNAPPELAGGVTVTGATVTTPGAPPRTLDANHATAFMQTWLAYSVFNKPANERPPAGLPVSQLDVKTLVSGSPGSPLVILYASDGTNAWVGAQAPPPDNEKWIRAPQPEKTIAGFEGRLDPIRPPTPATTTTTRASHQDSSSDTGTWVIVAILAVVILVGGALALRARRHGRAD